MENDKVNGYRDFLLYVLIFIASFGIIFFIFGTSFIPSASMEPTLSVGHKYPYFKLEYLVLPVKRGDIVIYDKKGVVYCKRVIGVPGDHLEIKNGSVYINGSLLEETYANGNTYALLQDTYHVPENEFFVMGDNRENSNDSRFWEYPFVKKGQILGHVLHK
ncbi:MAG: signal peptidase I [Lachnospiraceae bacterium]|nr:signal peptidase I [Lachnospiraceae bacterium]